MFKILQIICVFLISFNTFSQEISADSLLLDLTTDEVKNESLLPKKMLLTQRFFWGENGIYRKIGIAPKVLTNESRAKELKIRRTMFKVHQAAGLLTMAGMVAQGIIGSKLYSGNTGDYNNLRKLHNNMATGINIGYATTALMSFTSPPPFINRKKFDNIKLHKYLSYVHLTGMITTNVLSNRIKNNYAVNKPLHRAAAYTTFAAYTFAVASIKFEF